MDRQIFNAAQTGKAVDINILITNGANIKLQDKHGNMPLHWAVHRNNFETASTLIVAGAPVNAQNHRGSTPLHMAAENNRIKLGCLLLAHGASLSTKDGVGQTPLSPTLATIEFISVLSQRKKKQDDWVRQNEHMVAIIGSRIQLKVEKSLQEYRDEIAVKIEQQKAEMLAAQELAIKDSQGQIIDHLKQQQHSNTTEDDNDRDVNAAKRHKRLPLSDCSSSSFPSDCGKGLCGPRLAACEQEIVALREMFMSTITATTTEATSFMDTGVKIKMEDTSDEE